MTLVGTELHLFGGGDTSALDVPEMADVFNDHYVFDLHDMDWASPELHWRCPPADGVPPAPRFARLAAGLLSVLTVLSCATAAHGSVVHCTAKSARKKLTRSPLKIDFSYDMQDQALNTKTDTCGLEHNLQPRSK